MIVRHCGSNHFASTTVRSKPDDEYDEIGMSTVHSVTVDGNETPQDNVMNITTETDDGYEFPVKEEDGGYFQLNPKEMDKSSNVYASSVDCSNTPQDNVMNIATATDDGYEFSVKEEDGGYFQLNPKEMDETSNVYSSTVDSNEAPQDSVMNIAAATDDGYEVPVKEDDRGYFQLNPKEMDKSTNVYASTVDGNEAPQDNVMNIDTATDDGYEFPVREDGGYFQLNPNEMHKSTNVYASTVDGNATPQDNVMNIATETDDGNEFPMNEEDGRFVQLNPKQMDKSSNVYASSVDFSNTLQDNVMNIATATDDEYEFSVKEEDGGYFQLNPKRMDETSNVYASTVDGNEAPQDCVMNIVTSTHDGYEFSVKADDSGYLQLNPKHMDTSSNVYASTVDGNEAPQDNVMIIATAPDDGYEFPVKEDDGGFSQLNPKQMEKFTNVYASTADGNETPQDSVMIIATASDDGYEFPVKEEDGDYSRLNP